MYQPIVKKDPSKKTIVVERSFAAPRPRVWAAWTTSALLEQWWAPKPWKAVTKSFDFSPGGHWHYYMLGPDGTKEWCWLGYESITPETAFTAINRFADEDGNPRADMPTMHWAHEFVDERDVTKVIVTIRFSSEADMTRIIEMGFEGGFSMGLGNLDQVLAGKA